MMCTPYREVDNEKASIDAIIKILTKHEKDLLEVNVKIRCDDVLKWICFSQQDEEGFSVSNFLGDLVPPKPDPL